MKETRENVTRMEDILQGKRPVDKNVSSVKVNKVEQSAAKTNVSQNVPKGKPKSGRVWKEPRTRFSAIIKTPGTRLSFEKKQKLRNELKRVKELSRAVVAERQAQKEQKKQRRLENLKRAEENRKKNEIVQVIKNTAKLKNMKKKHLRKLEKRDTTNM